MNLRPYQREFIKNIRLSIREGHRKVIGVLPTGGGKTFVFSNMVKSAFDRGRKCLIITDRIELLTQAGGALRVLGLEPIKIQAGKKPYLGGSLYTAMVETLARRISIRKDYQYWLNQMDVVIIDECHKRTFTKLFPYINQNARVIGFTATPERMGKKDQLGETYSDLIVGVEIDYLVNAGFLAKPKYYGVKADLSGVRMKAGDYNQDEVASRFSETKLYKGVVENWEEKTPNTKTLVFSSNIANSKELVNEFSLKGYEAKHLDAKMTKNEREDTLKWFSATSNGILCNVGILTTGFDEPTIETVILYRATKSLPLYLQMVGRGSRTTPSKSSFSILDFGNNIATHGFWHLKREWDISIKENRTKTLGEAVLKNCPECGAFISASAVVCSECGFVDVKEKKEQEFAKLELLDPRVVWNQSESSSLEEKVELCKRKLIKPYRVIHNLTDYNDVKRFISLMGYSPYWMQMNYERFWWADKFLNEIDNGKKVVKILEKV